VAKLEELEKEILSARQKVSLFKFAVGQRMDCFSRLCNVTQFESPTNEH
jgi:hypothetical protein